MNEFRDLERVARYADNPPRLVPGFRDLQRMTRLLLAENAPDEARILVVGAGGGLELEVFAKAHPAWRFDGVDPSPEMLDLAVHTLGDRMRQVTLHQGYVFDAPTGPFDAATCLLTLHFLPPEERLKTLEAIRSRLKPGSPFIAAHHSVPEAPVERSIWLSRFGAFAADSGVADEQARGAAAGLANRLPILSPEIDEALMRAAGFTGVALFYAAFTFRGWIAYA